MKNSRQQETKKADVAEDPKVFYRVGLLINEPPGAGRAALYLVIRNTWRARAKSHDLSDVAGMFQARGISSF